MITLVVIIIVDVNVFLHRKINISWFLYKN
jgi:hypothetical protein